MSVHSGQTSTNSRPSGEKRSATSPCSNVRSHTAQPRRTLAFVTRIVRTLAPAHSLSTACGLRLRGLTLALRLLDDLLGNMGRNLLVAEEVHRVVAPASGHRRE